MVTGCHFTTSGKLFLFRYFFGHKNHFYDSINKMFSPFQFTGRSFHIGKMNKVQTYSFIYSKIKWYNSQLLVSAINTSFNTSVMQWFLVWQCVKMFWYFLFRFCITKNDLPVTVYSRISKQCLNFTFYCFLLLFIIDCRRSGKSLQRCWHRNRYQTIIFIGSNGRRTKFTSSRCTDYCGPFLCSCC